MRRAKRTFGKFPRANLSLWAAAAVLLTAGLPTRSVAQQQQKTFSSAEEAGSTLFTAMQNNDENLMLDILGPDAKRIVSSGDDTEDAAERANYVAKYQEMHRLVKEPDGTTTLYIGAENWPTPIPLVKKDNAWYFDTDAGKREILYRRVGQNEMSAMIICRALVAAQKEFYSEQHEYAHQIFSDEGQHNGLYWKAGPSEQQSPMGPLVASAVAEGYDKGRNGPPTPYHGYLFHILTMERSGTAAAKSYIVGGKMTGGFAFVAYPAEYRSSGVMTFIVGADGVVYQKDLGKQTDVLGKAMKTYNPGISWKKQEAPQEEAADKQKGG